ncbi:hypothetical protein LTR56_013596 [Elasticomyces elasticus]|nr:hypothetical protein LTR56_013596 [Elasticomyces elasticus]KAK3651060.1 hypothetical protein LTR22_012308 [Elasticomyces elasticus]KAK5765606.1 hypothetical protein LTS12_004358 [Elasticomyces elasticus]
MVLVAGVSDPNVENTTFVGGMMELTPHDADFGVQATTPTGLQDDESFSLVDSEERQRLPTSPLEMSHNLLRGNFCLRNIMVDPEVHYHSFPLYSLWRDTHQTPEDDQTAQLVRSLPRMLWLHPRQTTVVAVAMNTVPYAVLLIEGFPGSGKSKTMACLVVMLMLMGCKVLMLSQSNKSVDAIFRKALDIVQASGREDLVEKCVRLRTEGVVTAIAQYLASGLPDTGRCSQAAHHWMARRIHRYIQQYPDDKIGYEYLQHFKAQGPA